MDDRNSESYRRYRERQLHRLPISYIVKTQALSVRIFEFEDSEIDVFEGREYGACKRAYSEYLDKMFVDDEQTKKEYDLILNNCIVQPGTFKSICDELRRMGYEVLSKDNSSKEQMRECEKNHLMFWREWKQEQKFMRRWNHE